MCKKYLLFVVLILILFKQNINAFSFEPDMLGADISEEDILSDFFGEDKISKLIEQENSVSSLKDMSYKRKIKERQHARNSYDLIDIEKVDISSNLTKEIISKEKHLLKVEENQKEIDELIDSLYKDELDESIITEILFENMKKSYKEIRVLIKLIRSLKELNPDYIKNLIILRDKFNEYYKEYNKYLQYKPEEAKNHYNIVIDYLYNNDLCINKIKEKIQQLSYLEFLDTFYEKIKYKVRVVKGAEISDPDYLDGLISLKNEYEEYIKEQSKYLKENSQEARKHYNKVAKYMNQQQLSISKVKKEINARSDYIEGPGSLANLNKLYEELKVQANLVQKLSESEPGYIIKIIALRDKYYQYFKEYEKYKKENPHKAIGHYKKVNSYINRRELGLKVLENKVKRLGRL